MSNTLQLTNAPAWSRQRQSGAPEFGPIELALGAGVAALMSSLLMAVVEWMQHSLVVQERILRPLQRDGGRST